MEESIKKVYEVPSVRVTGLRFEGCLCVSGEYTVPGYGEAEEI